MDATEEETAPLVNRDREGSQRSSSSVGPGLQVHLYFLPATKDGKTFSISSGQESAESVCIKAAKQCGILPVYQSLFALASSDLSFWYPPTHVFNTEEKILVQYRVRFFFANWFGQGSKTSHRFSVTRGRLSPVLDYCVIDYLFAQCRSDFVEGRGGVTPPLTAQDECLGLAVLDLWRMSKEHHLSIRDICRTVSYKSCLPETHRNNIQKRNRLDRFRIRRTLKRFLKKLGSCSVDAASLKLKYLIALAGVEPSLWTETFKGTGITTQMQSQGASYSLLQVSGEAGIQTSNCHSNTGIPEWKTFCDFQEMIDISITREFHEQASVDNRVVTVTREDGRCLETKFQFLREALSFVSLVDGYFRLTTDSSHYFCREVAPPSHLDDLENHCHGPITSEFAVNKLKKAGAKPGMFVLRHSPQDHDKYFLTVCVQDPLGVDYKDCLITKKEHLSLQGVQKSFHSLRDLTGFYQRNKLLLGEVPVQLGRCCPPRSKELTNLIIIRSGSSMVSHGSPAPQRNKPSHIQFQMIKYTDLALVESIGQGSFSRIYRGTKTEISNGEKHVADVLLKELDVSYKNCWESFFEAASVMSQISHKHFLLVYGISVHSSKSKWFLLDVALTFLLNNGTGFAGRRDIMVQEFVKHGALDLYLKREKSVSVSWKLDIVKQLASALNFLEEKNIVHGNICAKNLLLAREGDASQGSSPFIKLSDPGINVAMLGRHVMLDRIPWIAPELVDTLESPQLECDKWSFGTTLWEIFSCGETPLQGWDLEMKLQFYKKYQQLPPSQWTELADLVSLCMTYQPEFRPSCRSIIRQLNSLITSDYVILHAAETFPQTNSFCKGPTPSELDQLVYEERHLRYIRQLGKGNFGSVELCRYDPLGDNTGELVAVKKLQPNKQSNMEDFQKEINTIRSLHCEYIVKYRGVSYSMGRLSMSLVMEYLPNGSLIGYLDKNRQQGLEYLQTMRYVHRDLAARNILVASETLVKIGDFGLTKILPFDKEYYRVKQPGESPLFWYAPESIVESKFSHMSDVWSFGVVLHELFSYCEHLQNPKKLYLQHIGNDMQSPSISVHVVNILKNNWRLPAPPHCPPRVYSLMMQCWAFQSEERPSFATLSEEIENMTEEERRE